MDGYVLRRKDLNTFLTFLMDRGNVSAPVAAGEGSFAFRQLSSPEEVVLDYLPLSSRPKSIFFPSMRFLVNTTKAVERLFRRSRSWRSVSCLQYIPVILPGYNVSMPLSAYVPGISIFCSAKEDIILIGYECNHYCDSAASCALMGNHLPAGGCDLMFSDLGEIFYITVYTETGCGLIADSGLFRKAGAADAQALQDLRKRKEEIFHPEVAVDRDAIPDLFSGGFDSPVWEELGRRCLSCGNCTNVCPTCYCFDVQDRLDLNLTTGRRVRVWDSCQHEPFARVAGGVSFRSGRDDRKRHRF